MSAFFVGEVEADRATLEAWIRGTVAMLDGVSALVSADDRALLCFCEAARRSGKPVALLDPQDPPARLDALCARLGARRVFMDPTIPWTPSVPATPIVFVRPPSLLERWTGRAAKADPSTWPTCVPAAEPRPPASPDAVAVILTTSGTTGEPRIVPRSVGAIDAQLRLHAEQLGLGPADRLFNLLPAWHYDGILMGPLLAWKAGATCIRMRPPVVPRLPTLLDLSWREHATHLVVTPHLLRLMVDQDGPLGGEDLRHIVSTAAALPDELRGRVSLRLTSVYGLTETGNACFEDGAVPGSIGPPVGSELRIEEGTLRVRGPAVVTRWWDGSPAVDAEGWFDTGDLAEARPDGIRVLGRAKRMVSIGGLKLSVEEVERALQRVAGVTEATVWGEPDSRLGERVVGVYVGTPEPAAVAEALRATLPPWQIPRVLRRVDTIPRGPSGKVRLDALPSVMADNWDPEQVYQLAAEVLFVPRAALRPDTSPQNFAPWDSVAHLALVAALEQRHGLVLRPSEAAALTTLAAVVERVRRHREAE